MHMQNSQQAPGYYRFHAGDIEVICVSDGTLSTDVNAVIGMSVEQAREMFDASHFPKDFRNSTNNYIIRSQARTALVDTGGGPYLDDGAGKLLQNAAAAGISPADIDTILFTHIHPDHCSGLIDKDGKKVFPHSALKMHAAEFDFWLSEDPRSKKIEHVKHEADHVIRHLTPYRDQIELFEGGEVFPGVNAIALHGHTPGHTGYMIASKREELLIWGDVIHWPVVQFVVPDAAMTYDVDPVQAAATRWDILKSVASNGLLVAGMHLFFPGFTRVRREGAAFAMAPVPWGHAIYSTRNPAQVSR
jgi:glyoxylase-like metal-dependent hydrolase (beta-lactamase superfamily II)